MLFLLKPWKVIEELELGEGSLYDNFLQFKTTTSIWNRNIIQNIQYYYQCSDSAAKRNLQPTDRQVVTSVETEKDKDNDPLTDVACQTYTADDVQAALEPKCTRDKSLYTKIGMSVAEEAGFFDEVYRASGPLPFPKVASRDDVMQFLELEKVVKTVTKGKTIGQHFGISDLASNQNNTVTNPNQALESESTVIPMATETRGLEDWVMGLNVEQKWAHDIVALHLRAYLNGRKPLQMLMIVIGSGGTGKSKLLNTITLTFEAKNAIDLLAKTVMLGVAATVIGGTTLHWWAGLPAINTLNSDEWIDRKMTLKEMRGRWQDNIEHKEWLAIDEISMLTTDLLTLTSQVTGFVKTGNGRANTTVPFGGMNIILLGDFHQFPPVANSRASLHVSPSISFKETTTRVMGCNIYMQFETVVTLTEQMRIMDNVWRQILEHSRMGDCTKDDLQEIRKLVLTNNMCDVPDFNQIPWDDVILVTPCNIMRWKWNAVVLQQYCRKSQNMLYICQVEDVVGKERRQPTMEEMTIVAGLDPEDDLHRLHTRIEVTIGMRAMVTMNISTEADLANGTQGTVTDIFLDPRERLESSELEKGIVMLLYPPAMVIFKPLHSTFPIFNGFEDGEIPLFPSKYTFRIMTLSGQKCSVSRHQYNLTPGYAFTHNKGQGQTLGSVIVDIQKPPPPMKLTTFTTYVALSRSRGRETIRLLGDSNNELFTSHPSEDLHHEDRQLGEKK